MIDVDKLFDFIRVFFNEPQNYKKLTRHQKAKHAFMMNRFCSIKYPVQAALFNKVGMDPAGLVDCWQMVAQQYKKTPSWIFTKTNKNQKDTKEYSPEDEILDMYLQINEIGMKEYKDALKYNETIVVNDLKTLEKQMTKIQKRNLKE